MTQRLNHLQSILKSKHQSRLQTIRNNSKLDLKQIRDLYFYDGCYEQFIAPIYQLIINNRNIFVHEHMQEKNKAELREIGAKIAMFFRKNVKLDLENNPLSFIYANYAMNVFSDAAALKCLIESLLYTKTLLLLQSNDQHRQFIRRVKNGEDYGCFGLTQFYHGSFSKGIVTQAVYDHENKEFILDSQGSKGMKFWIGTSSEMANIAVIWAQLVVNKKSHGPHPFIVPLRNRQTHQVFKGITIGDCGTKNACNILDNGFIMFDQYRIPKDNLLGKFGRVNLKGEYQSQIKSNDQRFGMHMSANSSGRANFAFGSPGLGINALTIALRYACSRRQFEDPKKKEQILIVDYPVTKIRLIPYFAQALIQGYGGMVMARTYALNDKIFSDPTNRLVGQLHAVSSALKVKSSWAGLKTITQCRSILGGHGYSAYSGVGFLFHLMDPATTGEGDNNIILQQTSKFLVRAIGKKLKTQVVDLSFVHSEQVINFSQFNQNLKQVAVVEKLLKNLFKLKYESIKDTFVELSAKIQDVNSLWDYMHPHSLNSFSLLYGDIYYLEKAKEMISKTKSQENIQFFKQCCCLWGFKIILEQRYGPKQFRKKIEQEVIKLSNDLTDRSISALDILAPPDYILGSPFGRSDGQGMEQYLNFIYGSNNTFKRVDYFEEIIEGRKR